MASKGIELNLSGKFDYKEIINGLSEIKKQINSSHIGEELRKQLETALSKVEVNIPALKKMADKGQYNSKELETFQKTIQQVSKDIQALNKLASEADFTKAFSEADTNKIKNFEKQLSEIENKLKTTREEILNTFANSDQSKIGGKSNGTLNGVIKQLLDVPPDQIEKKLSDIVKNAEQQAENARENFQNILSKSNKVKTGNELIEFLFGKNSGVEIKYGETTRLKETFNLLREAILSFDEDTPVEEVKAHIQELVNLVNDEGFQNAEGKQSIFSNFLPPEVLERLKQFQNDIPGLKALLGEEGLKTIADGEAEKLKITQEQAAFLKQRLDELVQTKKLTAEQAKAVEQALGKMNSKVQEGSEQIGREKAQADALSATFGGLAHRITSSISALTIFNRSIQIVRQAVTSVRELDAAFTQIAIVSEQTNEQAWSMFDSFNKLAKQYSITTKDLTEGAKLFYQQGLSAADTMKMVEASTVSAALGEVTMTEAANTLTAAIQGYNESAAVAMDYTDKIAMVGAVSAADFNELSTAMEKTASSAYTAGIDFDHLLGYLGKMIEVTREAPANLGTAMKTIIARFEDMKKDPMAILEDGVSANKVEAALATIGIALRNSEGEFRALQDVMDELGMKWNSLTRNQQAYIATVAAGSRQQSRFLALMNNYDRTLDLVAESQNSAGAAAQQYAVYQDSAAAATARLTAAWEEFYAKIVNSETIIFVIDSLTKLVETMSKVGPAVSAIGASIGALGLNTLIKVGLPKLTKGLADATLAGEAAGGVLKGLVKTAGANVLAFTKIAIAIGAAIGAIWLIVKAIQALDKAFHPARENAKKLANEIKELDNEINKTGEKTESLKNLLERYDKLNEKIYRTQEEQEELNKTIEQINDISNTAIISINKLGEAHLHNRDAVQQEYEVTKNYNDYLEEQKLQKQINYLRTTNEEDRTEEDLKNAGLTGLAELKNIPTLEENLKELEKIKELLDYATGIFAKSSGTQGYLGSNLLSLKEVEAFNNQAIKEYNKQYGTNYEYSDEIVSEDYEKFMEYFNQKVQEYAENKIEQLQYAIDNASEIGKVQNQEYNKLAQKYAEIYGGEGSEILSEFIKNGGINIESEEDLFEFIDNISEMSKNINSLKQLEKYNNQEISLEELIESIDKDEEFLLQILMKKLEKDTEEAGKELEKRNNERKQFWRDNLLNIPTELRTRYFKLGKNEGIGTEEVFGGDSKLSSQDLNYLSTFFKLNLDESSKVSLFDFIKENEDDKFQTLMQKYMDSLSKGITEESDELQQQIINTLTPIIPEKDIIKIINDFVPNYQELLEQKIDEDFSSYNTTRKGAADLTKLKSKERKSFLADNEDADKYFEYNEDGEEYLNILGKIVLLEQQRSQISKELNDEIQYNNNQISNNETQLEKVNEKLKKGLFTNEETEDSLKSQKATLEKNTEELEEANKLYQKQLDYINESTNLQEYEAMALQSNVNKAKEHADNIEAIAKAWAAYQQGTADSNLEAISTLNQLDASYQSLFMTVSNTGEEVFTLNQDIVDKMIANEQNEYQEWRKKEIQKLEDEKTLLEGRIQALEAWKNGNGLIYNEDLENKVKAAQEGASGQTDAENKGYQKGVENAVTFYQKMEEVAKQYFTDIKTWAENVYANIMNPENIKLAESTIKLPTLDVDAEINFKDFEKLDPNDPKNRELADKLIAQYQQRITIITATIAKLGDLSPEFKKVFDKAMKDAAKGGKDAEKAVNNVKKAVDDLYDSGKKLDELLKNIQKKLKGFSVDYNPFLKLFEEWEHEWDKFFNIKQLMKQIELQGNLINNIVDSDWATVDQKIEARKSSIGNIIEAMSANDLYIQALRKTLTEEENAFMEKYGRYGGVDTDTLTLYEKTANLHEMNDTINEVMLGIFNLEKELNDLGNQTNLFENQIQAAEDLQSAYESIVDTIDNTIEDIENNENITADTSGLRALSEQFKTVIKSGLLEGITDFNSDEFKERFAKFNIEIDKDSKIKTIDDLNDLMSRLKEEAQNMEVKIELETGIRLDKDEGFVEDFEDSVSRINNLWETLYSQVANQEELLQKLSEERNYYIDNAISVEKELYNAIVENYQREIDKKKKQYDELKQLDNEYLQSVRENINKEREMRNDAEKKKSYQQNIQRAQLLQMDTSGTYRAELASLNKEIKNQRDELYDDLVDKQVEALEKEIEARHEMYDKEVAAMEERLNYMQENSILIWEQVNNIISEGSEAMMSVLENTTTFMNSNELERQKIRENWELSTKNAYEAVNGTVIDTLEAFIESARVNIINKTPEVAMAMDAAEETYKETERIAKEMGVSARNIAGSLSVYNEAVDVYRASIDAFRNEWINETGQFTTHMETWGGDIKDLEKETRENIARIRAHNLAYNGILDSTAGSIKKFDESVVQSVSTLYDIFISDRENYKIELTNIINSISTDIAKAIGDAANAIKKAAESVKFVPSVKTYDDKTGGDYTPTDKSGAEKSNDSNNSSGATYYLLTGTGYTGYEPSSGYTGATEIWNRFATMEDLNRFKEKFKYIANESIKGPYRYAKGGLANYTGLAWLDGTKSNPERVLSPRQTKLFESMVSSLEKTANNSTINSGFNSSYNIGEIKTVIQVDKLDNQTDINKLAKQVEDKIVKDIRNRVSVSINKGV